MNGVDDLQLPHAGDLVWVDFRPTLGREQAGVRPALVLTGQGFHKRNAIAIVCPITGNIAPWPTKVILPSGLPVKGVVLCDHIRSVDRSSRGFRSIGAVPFDLLTEVRDTIAKVLGLRFDS
ncbi:type II toxin-antitoxin system PemK/MazF family toxin [Methylobacterium sp. Leaf466]|uniref:type II toxin-antitoxin system PemK/MazF family toxin n=1 Tax=Methylobacterium sp. Leaf466 TaxID=1736386 RepID=UPI0009ECAEF3|nr:type II toxin-antitoxin system PemK/MazF family toxin [Methylobacterium sp. Leaf466]